MAERSSIFYGQKAMKHCFLRRCPLLHNAIDLPSMESMHECMCMADICVKFWLLRAFDVRRHTVHGTTSCVLCVFSHLPSVRNRKRDCLLRLFQPKAIPEMIAQQERDNSDIVTGTRYSSRGGGVHGWCGVCSL